MTVRIGRLDPADAEAYRRVRLSALATNPEAFGSTYAEEASLPLATFAARLTSASIFGAWDGTEVVGTMLYHREPRATEAHKAHIHGVFVEPGYRRRGLGADLLNAVIDAARLEVEQLLLTVMAGNARAIALYQRFGFVTYGVEPRARKLADGYVDNVLMALLLNPASSPPVASPDPIDLSSRTPVP